MNNGHNYRVSGKERHTNITTRLMEKGTRIKIPSQAHKLCCGRGITGRIPAGGTCSSFDFCAPGPMEPGSRQRWQEVEHQQCVHHLESQFRIPHFLGVGEVSRTQRHLEFRAD